MTRSVIEKNIKSEPTAHNEIEKKKRNRRWVYVYIYIYIYIYVFFFFFFLQSVSWGKNPHFAFSRAKKF